MLACEVRDSSRGTTERDGDVEAAGAACLVGAGAEQDHWRAVCIEDELRAFEGAEFSLRAVGPHNFRCGDEDALRGALAVLITQKLKVAERV